MENNRPDLEKENLNKQKLHWEQTYKNNRNMFGEEPSEPAQKAAKLFKSEGRTSLLELGGGQGRDTFFFAGNGFQVTVLDYSQEGVEAISRKAQVAGLSGSITALRHDVREPLPLNDETFDACYSHMLFCMAMTTAQLEFIAGEIRRVLKPGGLNIYTVRHTGDSHYKTGIPRGEDMYEVGGFIVHFFDRAKVELLAKGYEIVGIDEFEEGALPKKLLQVTLRKDVSNRIGTYDHFA